MTKIKFGPEDVGKWAFSLRTREWMKIVEVNKDDQRYPIRLDSGWHREHEALPATHPAVLAGKLEIPIPPPPRERVVLEPGWYYRNPIGDIFRTTTPKKSPPGHHVFEITEPITLVEGEE
jgi:hypothetical protein